MVDTPSDEQVGEVVVMVGCDGTVNCAALLNEADATDVQVPLVAVTV